MRRRPVPRSKRLTKCHARTRLLMLQCMRVDPWRSWCVWVEWIRSGYSYDDVVGGVQRRICAMKQPKLVKTPGVGKLAVDDPKAFEQLPHLRSFFCDQEYHDPIGPRDVGVMILTARSGYWIATLKEPSMCLMLKVMAPTLDELWLSVEVLLEAEDAPWESDPFETQRRAKFRRRG